MRVAEHLVCELRREIPWRQFDELNQRPLNSRNFKREPRFAPNSGQTRPRVIPE